MPSQRTSHFVHLLTVLILLTGLLVSSGFSPAPDAAWQSKVDPQLLEAAPLGATEFMVFLSQQADLNGAAQLKTKAEKGQYVYDRLREVADRTQPAVLASLSGSGAEVRPFWVANMIWVRGNQQTIQAVAQRPDVERVYANPSVLFEKPFEEPLPSFQTSQPSGVEWNLQKVNAPAVWAAGDTGQGVVIGGQDTGYDWDHPALKGKYRGWNGSSADHNYNWHDAIHTRAAPDCPENSREPCDDSGHGTHTMGTMVGDDGAGNQVGMAPGARWIGCRNMNGGLGSPSTYAECYQWFLAPTDLNNQNPRPDLAPDVINNSWGCPPYEGCTEPDVLLQVVNNVRAAGILTVHSAGNEGSNCSSVSSPAAIYDASFTVGNTTSTDTIATSSSRGPVLIDGSGRLKPDISAPGTSIRSSTRWGSYSTLSGTSMAGPHVAGLAALLIAANPALAGQVDALETIIEKSAVPLKSSESCGGTAGQVPNNTYGWGRIDAWKAFTSIPKIILKKTVSASEVQAGEVLTYTVTVSHTLGAETDHNVVVTDTLPVSTSLITATLPYTFDSGVVAWNFPNLAENDSQSMQLVVQVPLTATNTIENVAYGAASAEAISPAAPPVTTRVIPAYDLELSPENTGVAWPGRTLTFTHSLVNKGFKPDSYNLTFMTSPGWAILTSPSTITLEPGASATLTINITVPLQANQGEMETTQVTVVSQTNPGLSARVTDRTTVGYRAHFPWILKP